MPQALAATMRERFGIAYNEGYGMTETASFLHANPLQRRKLGSLGVPGAGRGLAASSTQMTLRELPPGEVGEIVTHGPQVMHGLLAQARGHRRGLHRDRRPALPAHRRPRSHRRGRLLLHDATG